MGGIIVHHTDAPGQAMLRLLLPCTTPSTSPAPSQKPPRSVKIIPHICKACWTSPVGVEAYYCFRCFSLSKIPLPLVTRESAAPFTSVASSENPPGRKRINVIGGARNSILSIVMHQPTFPTTSSPDRPKLLDEDRFRAPPTTPSCSQPEELLKPVEVSGVPRDEKVGNT